MSDETKKETPATPTKIPFQINAKGCKEHLDKVIASQEKYVELPGHNPYKWLKDNVSPLADALYGADTSKHTKELQEKILALPLNNVPKYFDVTPKEQAAAKKPAPPSVARQMPQQTTGVDKA